MLKPKLAPPRPAILVDILEKPEVLAEGDANGFAVSKEDQESRPKGKGKGKGKAKGKGKQDSKGKGAQDSKGKGKQGDNKRQADWNAEGQPDWKKTKGNGKSWQDASGRGSSSSWNGTAPKGKGKGKDKGKDKGKGKGNGKNSGSAPRKEPVNDESVKLGPRGNWKVDEQWAHATVRKAPNADSVRLGTKAGGVAIGGFDQGEWIKLDGEPGYIKKVEHGDIIAIHISGGLGNQHLQLTQQVSGQSLCTADDFADQPKQAMQRGSTMPTTPQGIRPAQPAATPMAQASVGWKRLESRSSPGCHYYYNDKTGESQGDPPAPWEKKESRSQPGTFYYYNSATGVSSGEKPAM